jgi:hypothetical protein
MPTHVRTDDLGEGVARNSKSKITTADHTEEAITTGEAITTAERSRPRKLT